MLCSSRDTLSEYLAKNLVSLNEGAHGQRLQWVVRHPDGVVLVATACSRVQSLKHLLVRPMYEDPRNIAIYIDQSRSTFCELVAVHAAIS